MKKSKKLNNIKHFWKHKFIIAKNKFILLILFARQLNYDLYRYKSKGIYRLYDFRYNYIDLKCSESELFNFLITKI